MMDRLEEVCMANIIKFVMALGVSLVGTALLAALVQTLTIPVASNLWIVATGDVLAAQKVLFIWTLSAFLLALIFRLVFLIIKRGTHNLRPLEYPAQLVRAGFLSGGIAYGSIAVMASFLKGIIGSIEGTDAVEPQTAAYAMVIGLFPVCITLVAGCIAVMDLVGKMPKSKEPSSDEKQLVRLCGLLVRGVKIAINAIRSRLG